MTKQRRNLPGVAWCAALIFLVCAAAQGQRGARTLHRGLDQLTEEAELIVHGHVTSARMEPHPQLKNLTTVVISFNVQETLKGKAGKSVEYRQYIWDIRDRLDAARYAKGQELLLMLGPVSPYGLRSPVGLEQGRFRILRDRSGQAVAVNGVGNAQLMQGAEARAQAQGVALSARQKGLVRQTQSGPVLLDDLKEMIRAFAGAKPQ